MSEWPYRRNYIHYVAEMCFQCFCHDYEPALSGLVDLALLKLITFGFNSVVQKKYQTKSLRILLTLNFFNPNLTTSELKPVGLTLPKETVIM